MATIIAVAPNGGRRTKAGHPELPVTAAETARTAAACREAGAAMIHIHVRDENQRHSLDVDRYREAIAAARREAGPDMVIQATTESVGMYDSRQQMEMVRALKPEAISMGLRELAPQEDDKAAFAEFMQWLSVERIAPQIIIYDTHDAERVRRWAQDGVFDASATSVLFVVGKYVPQTTGTPQDLLPLHQTCAALFRDWMLCAFGPRETACVATAALLGGHCRVGFENNLHLPDGSSAPDNASIVRATASALTALGLSVMGPRELRELWKI